MHPHSRRSHANTTPLHWSDKVKVWNASDHTCFYCGTGLDLVSNFHVDHKIPRSMGGSNDASNLVASCRACNLKKGNKTADEFMGYTNDAKENAPARAAAALAVRVERQTLNIEDVGKILGISRPVAYELARKDDLPVPVIRLGRRMVVSKIALAEVLNRQFDE